MYSIKRTSPLLRYGVAAVVAGLALGIKLLLDPMIPQDVPFLLLFGAVMVSAWFGGLGPGLLTMVLAGLATDLFFLPRKTRPVSESCRFSCSSWRARSSVC